MYIRMYVCLYVFYIFYTNSWCPSRAYRGHGVARITFQGDTLQAYIQKPCFSLIIKRKKNATYLRFYIETHIIYFLEWHY